MKKLTEMNEKQVLERIYSSKKLKERFGRHIEESEYYYLNDVLHGLNRQIADYGIGFYNQNYIRVRDYYGFYSFAKQSADDYCIIGREKTRKLFERLERVYEYEKAFEYVCKQLAKSVLSDINDFCKSVEDILYDVYCNRASDCVLSHVEGFMYSLENIYEEEGKLYETVCLS